MPIKMMPHRFWVFLALPVAMLAGSGAVLALEYAQKHGAFIYWLVMLVVLVGVYSTSVVPKYAVETSMWPPGVSWTSNEQVGGYVKLGALPANTKVFSFCGNEDLVNGMNLFGYSWVKEVRDYKSHSIKDSSEANYEFLKRYGYQYAVIDTTCLKINTEEEVAAKLDALSMDSRFQPMQALSGNAFYVFRIS